jgi:hypothetical protein
MISIEQYVYNEILSKVQLPSKVVLFLILVESTVQWPTLLSHIATEIIISLLNL